MYLPIHQSICLSINQSIHPSIYPYTYPHSSIYVCIYIITIYVISITCRYRTWEKKRAAAHVVDAAEQPLRPPSQRACGIVSPTPSHDGQQAAPPLRGGRFESPAKPRTCGYIGLRSKKNRLSAAVEAITLPSLSQSSLVQLLLVTFSESGTTP